MNARSHPPVSRRDFLRAWTRRVLLGALALLGGTLAWRAPAPGEPEPCLKQRVCRGCGLWNSCALPQALAARKNSS